MRTLAWWKRSLAVVAGVAATVAVLAVRSGQGEAAMPVEPFQGQAFQYFGSGECKRCHDYTREEAIRFSNNAVPFIQLDEYKTWKDKDKHSIAFARLVSERGRRIAGLLKVDVTKSEAGCLGCHSASVEEKKNRAKPGDLFDMNEGVSCENCHGPYSGWAAPHTQEAFRTQSTEEWAKVGFNDLRSPDRQSSKCLSCHIGNSEEGKVVTHEMYAAGHPPLPSIEVATFSNFIPRHWWLQAERKNEAVKAKLGFKPGQLEQTKLALIGSAVALRTSMRLLADEAKLTGPTSVPGLNWPDYARFDCWSCHHDLKRQSWRQERGYEGPPGRVPVSQWPLALVELGIERLALDDPSALALRSDLQRFQTGLRDQANARPFGGKAPLSKAADELADWSDLLVKRLSAATFDRAVASKLLRKLVEKAEQLTPDYDSARHIAWTIKILVEDLGDSLPNREAIQALIKKLDEGLNLNIPAGRKYEIEDQIGSALQTIGDYEPATFQGHLKELLGLLPPG